MTHFARKTSLTTILLFALTFLSDANAEQDDLGAISLEDLLNLEIVTASKSAQKVSDAPATVYVITDDQINRRGYRHLVELLEDIPEIEIQHRAVAEYNNFYTFRGISGNEKFVVLLDGFRINSPHGTPHAVATNYGLSDAKRVEVILGPASALYGADAFGGIINIITKTGEQGSGTRVHFGTGQFGTYDSSINYGMHKDDFSLMFTAQFYKSDEPNMAQEYPDEFSWYNTRYATNGEMRLAPFLPDVILDLGDPRPYATPTDSHFYHLGLRFGKLEVGYAQAYESHNDSTGMLPDYNLYVEDAVYTTKISNLFARHTYELNDKIIVQTSYSKAKYELLPESKFLNTFTSYRDGYKYAYGLISKFEEQVNWVYNETNAFVFGVNFDDVSALPKTGDLPFPYDQSIPADLQGQYYLGTNINNSFGDDLTVYQAFYPVNYKNFGAYFQWQATLTETTSLTAGARYDNNTRYGNTTNPRVGLVVKPADNLTMKILYSEGFLAPSPYNTFQHYGGFIPDDPDFDGVFTDLVGPFWHLPNPNLKPEELTSQEFSVAYNISSKLKFSFDYYRSEVDQLITPTVFFYDNSNQLQPAELAHLVDFDGTFQGVPVLAAEIPINVGTSDIDGGTLRLDTLHFLGDWKLNGYAAYSFSDGKIAGKDLTYSADKTAKVGIEISKGSWSIFPKILKRSRSLHQRVDGNGDRLSVPGFTRVDLYTQYAHQLDSDKQFTYFIKIKNLFDKKHYNPTFGQDEAFVGSPQDPRRIIAGLEVNF